MKSIVDVTTAASTYDLTTLQAVMMELKKTSVTNDEEALIRSQISGQSASIARYCGRVFPAETVTETFWPDPNALNHHGGGSWPRQFWGSGSEGTSVERLYLERYPIVSITDISIDGDPALDSTEYRIDNVKGFVYRLDNSGYPWTWIFGKSIVVNYVGGYATIPADLARAATLSCVDAQSSSAKDSLIKSETVYGVASTTYFDNNSISQIGDLSERVLGMLEFYRRIPVG